MIVGDTEFTFVDHEDHMDLLVTQGHQTIMVSMTPNEIMDLVGELSIKFVAINRRIRSGY